jgi:rhamnogalacturonyl hydrolase YesR
MCAALLPATANDGYWNVSLNDPNNFGGKEVSGTSLFIYGFAWGINNNILDKKTYLPAITKAWNAMSKEACSS